MKETKKIVEVYVSDDGKEFNTKEECEKYEQEAKKPKLFYFFVNISLKDGTEEEIAVSCLDLDDSPVPSNEEPLASAIYHPRHGFWKNLRFGMEYFFFKAVIEDFIRKVAFKDLVLESTHKEVEPGGKNKNVKILKPTVHFSKLLSEDKEIDYFNKFKGKKFFISNIAVEGMPEPTDYLKEYFGIK